VRNQIDAQVKKDKLRIESFCSDPQAYKTKQKSKTIVHSPSRANTPNR